MGHTLPDGSRSGGKRWQGNRQHAMTRHMRSRTSWMIPAVLIQGVVFSHGESAVIPAPAAEPIRYIVFEGGGPDQGPGLDDHAGNRAALLHAFGPADPASTRQIAYGIQQIRILTRSSGFVAAQEVIPALDAAETTGIPVWLHIDPLYGWGADGENTPSEAPPAKFWEHPKMREWREFPVGGLLPDYIPRIWFCWGPWCSPASAFPAIGAPKFVALARAQLREGVLAPLTERLETWRKEGRTHLFAGINIGWETHLMHYRSRAFLNRDPATITTRHHPHPDRVRGRAPVELSIDPDLIGSQLGYASLHWRGWNEDKLRAAAAVEGIPRDEKFRRLVYAVIHEYMTALAEECHLAGLSPDRVYTHVVAMSTVVPADTFMPPVWTAVNPFSTPGFTMDNKGAARYDMATLLARIRAAPGSRGSAFGRVEAYFKLGDRNYVGNSGSFLEEIDALFSAGATVQVFFGGFPFKKNTPAPAVRAIQDWMAGIRPMSPIEDVAAAPPASWSDPRATGQPQ